MGSTVFEFDMFGTAEMRAIFDDKALVGRYVEVEVALARAQARLDVVPRSASIAIEEAGRRIAIDYEKLRRETEIVGYPILPLVHATLATRLRSVSLSGFLGQALDTRPHSGNHLAQTVRHWR